MAGTAPVEAQGEAGLQTSQWLCGSLPLSGSDFQLLDHSWKLILVLDEAYLEVTPFNMHS